MTESIFICGDSHSGFLAAYAERHEVSFKGGAIAHGLILEKDFFELTDLGQMRLTFEGCETLQAIFADLPLHRGPVLSTVGFNSHRAASDFFLFLKRTKADLWDISDAAFHAAVLGMRRSALRFYEHMSRKGREVYFTTSPQLAFEPAHLPALRRFEAVLIQEVQQRGARLVDVRPLILRDGITAADFALNEGTFSVHGSEKWAAAVFGELRELRRSS